MFKFNIFFFMLAFCALQIASTVKACEFLESDTSIFNTPYEASTGMKERDRIDAQVSAYDVLYKRYDIKSRSDVFDISIPEYINVATFGILYVKHHHPLTDTENFVKNEAIHQSCDALFEELMAKESAGLTPIEFILFNMKLALLQEYYPDGYPLEFDQEMKSILKDGQWKAINFYDFSSSARAVIDFNSYKALECRLDLMSQLQFSMSALNFAADFAFKPYIIYSASGGFKPSRIVKQNLNLDGKNRSLCALPCGTVNVENSPHGIYERTPYSFFMHELRHANGVFIKLSEPIIQRFLKLAESIIKAEHLEELILGNFMFLFLHESIYDYYLRLETSHDELSFLNFLDKIEKNLQESQVTYSDRAHEKIIFDPFSEIMKRTLGDNFKNLEGAEFPPLGKIVYLSDERTDRYQGVREILVGDKKSTFKYTVRRIDERLPKTPFYQYAEILAIEHELEDDTNPLDTADIEQILSVKEQKYLVLTKQAVSSNSYGNIKTLNKALGRSSDIMALDPFEIRSGSVVIQLAFELLQAFKTKVAEIMPDILA